MFSRTPRQPTPAQRQHDGDVALYRQRLRDIDAQLPGLSSRTDHDKVRRLTDQRNAYATWLTRHGHQVPPMPAIAW